MDLKTENPKLLLLHKVGSLVWFTGQNNVKNPYMIQKLKN